MADEIVDQLKIETRLDTQGFENDIKRIEKSLRNLQQATKARSQFNMQRGVVEVWLDAYQRNAHGLRDALGG